MYMYTYSGGPKILGHTHMYIYICVLYIYMLRMLEYGSCIAQVCTFTLRLTSVGLDACAYSFVSHTFVYVHRYTYIHLYTYVCMYTHMLQAYIHIDICTLVNTYTMPSVT